LKIHFNILIPSTTGSSKCFLSLRSRHQKTLYPPIVSHTCHIPRQRHYSWFLSHEPYLARSADHKAPRYTVFSTPLLPLPLRPKYLPQRPILEYL